MKAVLNLELFGDDTRQQLKFYTGAVNDMLGNGVGDAVFGRMPSNCWVAEIVSSHEKYKYDRRFLKGKKDYSRSNSKGSRGIYLWFTLESGRYYEVKEQISWRRVDRYFVTVSGDGDVMHIDEEDVKAWLKNRLE